MKFKIGDIIRCIVKNGGSSFVYGESYEVIDAYKESGRERILIAVDSRGSRSNGWLSSCFELVNRKPKNKYKDSPYA